MHRTQFVQPADFAVDGLPHAVFAILHSLHGVLFMYILTWMSGSAQWPTFIVHRYWVRRVPNLHHCQPMTFQWAAAAARGLRLITADELHNLRQQPFGHRLLQLVQDREWERVSQDQEAVSILPPGVSFGLPIQRCQELHQHFRLQHPELWEFAPQKAIQLTNLYSDMFHAVVVGRFFSHICAQHGLRYLYCW